MNLSKQITFFSRFRPWGDGDGGFRRTAQIVETLAKLDCDFVSAVGYCPEYHAPRFSESDQFKEYIKDEPTLSAFLEKWKFFRQDHIAYLHYVSWSWRKNLEKGSLLKAAVVDDPIYFAPLVKYLSLSGIPIIANCHNVEALSRSQLIEQHQLELLNYEIELLSLCSLVITISREETVFLQNLGINALFYPYFPVKDTLDRMLNICEKRRGRRKEDFLMLGTAHNPPTMAGMREVMTRWSDINREMSNSRLFVGGFGTEPLKELADSKNVVYKGAMTNEELAEMLCKIKACIVYQGDGSGALTKICEFLLAGVPVLANSHAARSYYNMPGVIEFTDIHDIAEACKILNSGEIEIRAPAAPDPNSLLFRIKGFLDAAGFLKASDMKRLMEEMLSSDKDLEDKDAQRYGLKRMMLDAVKEYDNKLRVERDAIAAERDAIVAERDALSAERDAIAAERDGLAAHREELLNSLSWRLTVPLRKVGKYFIKKK